MYDVIILTNIQLSMNANFTAKATNTARKNATCLSHPSVTKRPPIIRKTTMVTAMIAPTTKAVVNAAFFSRNFQF